MQGSAQGSPGSLGGQVGSQGRNRLGIVTRVIGKLHCDWLCRTLGITKELESDIWQKLLRNEDKQFCRLLYLGDRSIELSNCPFRFYSLVKSDKTNSF